MRPDDTKIEVFSMDEEDDCYCAIVMGYLNADGCWYNTGIVMRDPDPEVAFRKALTKALEVDSSNSW